MKNTESGKAFLEKSPFCHPGEHLSNDKLILTLFHITQYPGIPRTAIEGLRAVALLLEEGATPKPLDESIQQFKEAISTSLTAHVIAALSPQVAAILTTSETLKANVTDIIQAKKAFIEETQRTPESATAAATRAEEAADAVLSSIGDVKNAIELLAPSLNATQDSINTMARTITDSSNQPSTQQNARSYSAVAQQNVATPVPVTAALLRAATRDRQILFDPTPGKTLFEPNTAPADIAAKMKQAMLAIRTEDSPDIQIKATTRLRNGGIIIELTTLEAAQWIRTPANRLKIIEALDIPASIKERRFSVIVPFLLISSEIETSEWHRAVEEENNMPKGSIESANWIKPKNRRTPEQRVAHAIIHFADPTTANTVLRDGIYISQEKLHPRKDKREPVRCVRCQQWGHVAKDCKAAQDTCGTCGKNHRTNECNSYKTHYCVSCKSDNHASWDRNCPEFENRCAGIDAKLPENSMPYFPTDETWTQVMLPPKPAPYRKPPTQSPPNANQTRPALRQTNIQFETNRPNAISQKRHSRPIIPTGLNSIPMPNWGDPETALAAFRRNRPAPPTDPKTPTNTPTPLNTPTQTAATDASNPRNTRTHTPPNV